MLSRLAVFAFAILSASSLVFGAQTANALPALTECTVADVKDGGDYENENDFTFSDYPSVDIDLRQQDDKKVLIGALSFSEQDSSHASAIKVVEAYGSASIDIVPEESGDRFYLRVDFRKGTGEFQRLVNGTWIPVATLTCK